MTAHDQSPEQLLPETALSDAINGAAAAHDISLEPDRLLHLTQTAERIQRNEQMYDNNPGWERGKDLFWDSKNEVQVGRPAFSDHFGATAAQVDFAPTVALEGDFVSGDTSARPEHTTLFTHMLIDGLQNYALLADAGVIEKPAVLFGNTNPEMAILAERFGMFSDIAR